ncbi:sugar transferase [Ornithinimicrobium cryptoxanthini]|uniref:sugar transferase n=1 Tax=Ornithinimicrobium cryptoxanthini TaxID=2934161 RepID=UPI002119B0EE|nr:sugar transferase [Ornithinimicrobium cryptoxanthini]
MTGAYARVLKRALDLALAAAALPVAAVVVAPAALAVRLEDGGPVLHVSTRLGRDRAPFLMLKLRTMHTGAPDLRNPDGTTFSALDDPRTTRVGRLLRRTSIDELPQLLNVLAGQMSLVGPRPSPPDSQASFRAADLRRYEVRPGITGLSQVLLRNEGTLTQRLETDVRYVDELSLRLDLWVLGRTVTRVLGGRGVHRPGGAVHA